MRILMVQTFYYHRGGDSTYMLALAKLLEEKGHEVIPFAMKHPSNLPSPYSNYFVGEIDFPELFRAASPRAALKVVARSIHNGEARKKIAALVDKVKPDIAHFHNIHAHLTASIIAPLRKRGIPIVWTLHDYRLICPNTSLLSKGELCERCLPNRFYEAILQRCKRGSLPASFIAMLTTLYDRFLRIPTHIDRFITPSNFLKAKLMQGGFDPARIENVPNFVDLSGYAGLPEKDYFCYIGRLSHEKGLDILIRAMARLDEGRLLIVGRGPDEEDLKELAAELGTRRVEFAGFQSGAELERILADSQFVVLPSRWYENLPFAIMEAFASSKPVVASRIGGIPEMVDDGINGLLFPTGDVDALAASLRRMLGDRRMREEMGRRGREKAERLYEREAHYAQLDRVYRAVIAEKRLVRGGNE
jgi:glycosyltransferase involved in cell wall biosynthesis